MKSKELRQKRAKLVADARAIHDSADKAGRLMGGEENVRFDAMMAEADGLKAEIDRIERLEDVERAQFEQIHARGEAAGLDPEQVKGVLAAERQAFNAWFRFGDGALNEEQRRIRAQFVPGQDRQIRNDLGVTTDPGGGYLVPEEPMQRLIDAQLAYGGMLEASEVLSTTTGAPLPIPTDNDTSNKGALISENTQVTTQDVPFGAVILNAYEYTSKAVKVSRQLLQDSAFDIDAFLTGKLGIRIARIINDDFTTGTGAARPSGIVGPAPNAATLGYTAGGSTSSGSTTSLSFDDLIELEHSVDPAYRAGARYMFHDATLKSIKKLKDGLGRPLWMPGLAVKEPDTINQYPYTINQSMPTMAASAKCVTFGDFRNYVIRRVTGVVILRLNERYADQNQVGFMAFQRWDGALVDAGTHPVKYLQNSAT